MYMVLSESQVFNTLLRAWPMFEDFKSFNQLLCEGWVNNVFFNKNIPYIGRSNKRISEERFWNVFVKIFSRIDEPDGFILFHEKHAGWKKKRGRRIRNGVSLYRLLDEKKTHLSASVRGLPNLTEWIEQYVQKLDDRTERLNLAIRTFLTHATDRFQMTARLLDANSYERVLDKGFAFVQTESGQIISSAADANTQTRLSLGFKDGKVPVTVIHKPTQGELF